MLLIDPLLLDILPPRIVVKISLLDPLYLSFLHPQSFSLSTLLIYVNLGMYPILRYCEVPVQMSRRRLPQQDKQFSLHLIDGNALEILQVGHDLTGSRGLCEYVLSPRELETAKKSIPTCNRHHCTPASPINLGMHNL